MQLVIPTLFQTNALLDSLGEPRLSVLETLLARGRTESAPRLDLSDWLCHRYGITRQQDMPIAAIHLSTSGIDPGQAYWLCADPVHVRIERDQLILNPLTDLSQDEAEQLRTALATHFGEDFTPRITRNGSWVVQAHQHTQISTTALPSALGHHIDPLLPQGADAMHWRKLLNEVQMLLFAHPVNQAREARGQAAANSVWLWGGGTLPVVPTSAPRPVILGNHPLAQTLSQFVGASQPPMPDTWPGNLEADYILIDGPYADLQRGDYAAWLNAVKHLEQHWLHPLYQHRQVFELHDPLAGKTLKWKPADRWKFWLKPERPQRQTFSVEAPGMASQTATNVDEFGNRF